MFFIIFSIVVILIVRIMTVQADVKGALGVFLKLMTIVMGVSLNRRFLSLTSEILFVLSICREDHR